MSIKDDLLLDLDAVVGRHLVRGYPEDPRNRTSVTALTWAAEVTSLLPEDHPLFEKLAAAQEAEGWPQRQRDFLARWGFYVDPKMVATGLMFVVELGSLADKFLDEAEG